MRMLAAEFGSVMSQNNRGKPKKKKKKKRYILHSVQSHMATTRNELDLKLFHEYTVKWKKQFAA